MKTGVNEEKVLSVVSIKKADRTAVGYFKKGEIILTQDDASNTAIAVISARAVFKTVMLVPAIFIISKDANIKTGKRIKRATTAVIILVFIILLPLQCFSV